MTAFEHVTALFSFVYALALAHLLIHIGELVSARDRVKFSGLLALAMANAILNIYLNWLSLWDLRTIKVWDLGTITIQFGFAIVVFLICVFVSPKVPREGDLDLDAFYWHQRISIYSALLVMGLLALIANTAYLKSANATLFIKENALVPRHDGPDGSRADLPRALGAMGRGARVFLRESRLRGSLLQLGQLTKRRDERRITEFANDYAQAWCSHDPQKVAAFYIANGTISVDGGAAVPITEAVRGFVRDSCRCR